MGGMLWHAQDTIFGRTRLNPLNIMKHMFRAQFTGLQQLRGIGFEVKIGIAVGQLLVSPQALKQQRFLARALGSRIGRKKHPRLTGRLSQVGTEFY